MKDALEPEAPPDPDNPAIRKCIAEQIIAKANVAFGGSATKADSVGLPRRLDVPVFSRISSRPASRHPATGAEFHPYKFEGR